LPRAFNLPDIVGAFLAGLAVNAVTPSRVTIGAASLPITAPMTDIGLASSLAAQRDRDYAAVFDF